MADIKCPFPTCGYSTGSVEHTIAAELLRIHGLTHNSANARAQKIERPSIGTEVSAADWNYFESRWKDYVTATGITGTNQVLQLLECCDEQLRRDITRNAGGSLTSRPIDEVIETIKSLAVRRESVLVARATLMAMRQDRDEPIRAYCARVRGQAAVCQYAISCPDCTTEIDYADNIIRDVIAHGLDDKNIQLELLSYASSDPTLEEVLHFVEKKEAGKRSASKFGSTAYVDTSSTYRKLRRTPDDGERCTYCGKSGHGRKSSPQTRKTKCPAFGHTCENCLIKHHFSSVCRGGRNPTKSNPTNLELHADNVCAIDNQPTTSTTAIALDHHIHDNLTGTWLKRPANPQPIISLTASIDSNDYTDLAINKVVNNSRARITCIADTGCQSCLSGTHILPLLNRTQKDLIPVTTTMRAANHQRIPILGALILHLHDHSEEKRSSKQMVYITNSSDKFFLNRDACADLGIITKNFPTIGECSSLTEAAPPSPTTNTQQPHLCDCPPRQKPPPRPSAPPFPANEANRKRLSKWLLDYYASSTFNTCEHTPLPMMSGPPLHLMIDHDKQPIAHHTPIPVPVHWQNEVKASLDRDVELGVIEPVPIGTPVTYCHRMVTCAKKNGKPRRTVDMQSLNANAKRETHHTPSPFHLARSVPQNTVKTVCDAWNGYHSVPLHVDDRHLTTFITPWGRFRYRTCPQGYIASGDAYTRRFDEIASDFPNKVKCIDDTLLWASSIEECFHATTKWLDLCGNNGITLNPEKFDFASNTVEFAGFEITSNDVRPCHQFLRAVTDFPSPKNITDIRSWFGLVNQAAYAFSMATVMAPFRELLKPRQPFYWDHTLEDIFQQSKQKILEEISNGVRIFDKERPTCLITDWSRTGLGFWLLQKHCNCPKPSKPFCCTEGWKLTLVGSRFTHPAESRYAPVEGEALAVADALDRAKYFVLGCPDLTVAVDHKPLLGILGPRPLDDISNPRLRNIKEKTLRYSFRLIYIPGIRNKVSDCLSRSPSGPTMPERLRLEDDSTSAISTTLNHTKSRHAEDQFQEIASSCLDGLQSVTWDRVQTSTSSDPNLSLLVNLLEEENPPESYSDWPDNLSTFYRYRDHLYTIDGVLMYKDRVVIPPPLRQDCLRALHSAHQGTSMMTARAKQSIFWPGISNDIATTRSRCEACNRIAPSQPSAPPAPRMDPLYPFQCICSDYFHYKGHNYLIIVDRYSNWPIVERATDGASGLIACLRRVFSTYGIADELSSDGGPEFTATQTQTFLQQWGTHHRLSSTAHPHSNCRAEVGVKTIKRLILDNTGVNGSLDTNNFQRAVLQYRNTPDPSTKISPAQCLFGRPTRDFIPIKPGKYLPHKTWRSTLAAREEALRHRHTRDGERWSEHTRRLAPLKIGDHVRIQNQTGPHPTKWDYSGVVVEVRQFDQYLVRVDGSGRTTARNRKFLRRYEPYLSPGPRRSILDDITALQVTPSLSVTDPNPQSPPLMVHSSPPTPAVPLNDTGASRTAPPTTDPEPRTSEDITPQSESPPRRSGRETRPPAWLKDFVLQ